MIFVQAIIILLSYYYYYYCLKIYLNNSNSKRKTLRFFFLLKIHFSLAPVIVPFRPTANIYFFLFGVLCKPFFPLYYSLNAFSKLWRLKELLANLFYRRISDIWKVGCDLLFVILRKKQKKTFRFINKPNVFFRIKFNFEKLSQQKTELNLNLTGMLMISHSNIVIVNFGKYCSNFLV